MPCDKDHAPNLPQAAFKKLEDSQAGFWRHKCAGCAYELGRKEAADAEARLRDRVRQMEQEIAALKGKK